MLNRRTQIGLWSVTGLTALVGLVNLWSAVTPGLAHRVAWVRDFFPVEIRIEAHVFAALSGLPNPARDPGELPSPGV